MREALFSQDGWGCQHVNQDTNWEVPSSPEPTNKDASAPPMWKPSVNNGTDLWESNLRNGGQPPAQQIPKPSWGHTPSSNLGGTWGEDDDGADTGSVWTGGSVNNTGTGAAVSVNPSGVNVGPTVVPTAGPQWGQGVVGVGVGLGSTGNNSGSGTSGTLPVVTPGCGSGSSNITGASGIGAGGGNNAGNTGNGWGDPREIRPLAGVGGGPMDIRNVDHRETLRGGGSAGASSGDPRDIRMIDPRDPIRGDPRGISGRLNGTSEMWGHHPQMSHNQLQNMSKMVGQVSGSNVGATSGPGIGPGPGGVSGAVSTNIANQWGPTQTVGVGGSGTKDKISGWEEPSPPPQRRNIPNYDDGTSLWGQQTRVTGGGGGGHWKDMTDSIGRNHLIRGQNQTVGIGIAGVGVGNSNVPVGGNPNNPMTSVVGPQARLSSVSGVQHKPDGGTMWVHTNNVSGRNTAAGVTAWGDDSHNVGLGGPSGGSVSGSNWVDDKSSAGLAQNSWSDTSSVGVGWGNKQSKLPSTSGSSGWSTSSSVGVGVVDGSDLGSDWSAHGGIVKSQQQQKMAGLNVGMVNVLNTEMIKQSKQYRILVENGFKKEDVERALVTSNMNIEEAADMLRANSSLAMDGWRRHEESLGSYSDHSSSTSSGGFAGRYPVGAAQPSMSFPPNNLMNNMGAAAVTGSGSNNPNMAAMQVQKYLSQGPHGVAVGPQSVGNASAVSVGFGQGSSNAAVAAAATVNIAANTNNQPSGQQIRMLGQQIQLAIHSGFISSQILTQPLTQTTLNLLNQLLSNIKHLQAAQQSLARGGNANPMAVNVAIAKYKQQIQNLQNQINAQQAVYIKQQNLQPNSQQQQQQQQQQQTNGTPQHAAQATKRLRYDDVAAEMGEEYIYQQQQQQSNQQQVYGEDNQSQLTTIDAMQLQQLIYQQQLQLEQAERQKQELPEELQASANGQQQQQQQFSVYNVQSLTDDAEVQQQQQQQQQDVQVQQQQQQLDEHMILPSIIYEITDTNQVSVLEQQKVIAEFLTQAGYENVDVNVLQAATGGGTAAGQSAAGTADVSQFNDDFNDFDFTKLETVSDTTTTNTTTTTKTVKLEATNSQPQSFIKQQTLIHAKCHEESYFNVMHYSGQPRPLAMNTFGLVKLPNGLGATLRKNLLTTRKANNSLLSLNGSTLGVVGQLARPPPPAPHANNYTALSNGSATGLLVKNAAAAAGKTIYAQKSSVIAQDRLRCNKRALVPSRLEAGKGLMTAKRLNELLLGKAVKKEKQMDNEEPEQQQLKEELEQQQQPDHKLTHSFYEKRRKLLAKSQQQQQSPKRQPQQQQLQQQQQPQYLQQQQQQQEQVLRQRSPNFSLPLQNNSNVGQNSQPLLKKQLLRTLSDSSSNILAIANNSGNSNTPNANSNPWKSQSSTPGGGNTPSSSDLMRVFV